MSKWIAVVAVLLVCMGGRALGQTDDGGQQPSSALGENPPTDGIAVVVTPPAPTTHLETVQRRTGTVLVRGFTDVAGLRSDDNATVRVLAVELTDVRASEKVVGLAIEVRPAARGSRAVMSFVDENEIDDLIAGLDALTKVEHNTTSLTGYEAAFSHEGDAGAGEHRYQRFAVHHDHHEPDPAGDIAARVGDGDVSAGAARELEQQLSAAKQTLTRTKPQQ